MGYLAGFKNDVFISYPHDNNWDAWVTDFHSRFERKLAEVLGETPTVWRDVRLRSTHLFDEEILAQLRSSGVLLAIASPRREHSEWCARELEEFRSAAEKRFGFHVGTMQRALVVVKLPSQGWRHREILPRSVCIEFFSGEPDSFTEFALGSNEYHDRLSRAAQDTAAVLRELRRRQTVYLAGGAPDTRPLWDKLFHELQDRDFLVRPAGFLESGGSVENVLREWLGESCLSVHILCAGHSDFTVRQIELARELRIPRVIWAPPETEVRGKQKEWIDALRADPGGADFLDGKRLDYVKDFLLARLLRPGEAAATTAGQEQGLVYLACGQEDHPLLVERENNALRIRDYLFRRGLEVDTPVTGDLPPARLRKDAESKLALCDAVILYWGEAGHGFVEETRNLFRKALARRGARPFRSTLIYISDPSNTIKNRYQTREAMVKKFGPFNPEDIQPFLDALRTSE